VKVLDFGLAKLVEQEARRLRRRLPAWRARPLHGAEQMEDKPADTRSDIFVFGCILYEMLSGRGRSRRDHRRLPGRSAITDQTLEGVPEQVDKLVRLCLRKTPKPSPRHRDARIMLEALREGLASGEPELRVSAGPSAA